MKIKCTYLKALFIPMLLLLSCSSDGDDTTPPPGNGNTNNPPPPVEENSVRLRTAPTFGSILTDKDGKSLYFFSLDYEGHSECTSSCLDAWPVFYVDNLTLDQGLNAGDFGSITRDDGAMQTTYKGWPLYYFASDNAAGDVNGDGVNAIWYVAKPDYTVMMVRAQLVGRNSSGDETNLTSAYEPGDEETFYMTDTQGNTLYRFVNDRDGVNNFTADDFSNNGVWPIFEEDLDEIPSILNASDFGSITVFGRQQLTYKGWPLYYFGQDTERGDNYGVGFPAAGVWPILNPESPDAPEPENQPITYSVVNGGMTTYQFSGGGLSNASNPELTLTRGNTYTFEINAAGHPFFIKTVQSLGQGDQYNEGVTNNGAAVGTITFTVPVDAPDTLYYACEFHAVMTGVINIVD